MKTKTLAGAALSAAAIGLGGLAGASAAEVEVKMLNKGAAGAMVFEPAFVEIALGDTVRFVPTDKGHDAASIPGMLPERATPFTGKMNQEIVVVFDKPGVYGVKCKPHYGMGMMALVIAGEPANLDAAMTVKHPGKAKKAFAGLFDELRKTLASR